MNDISILKIGEFSIIDIFNNLNAIRKFFEQDALEVALDAIGDVNIKAAIGNIRRGLLVVKSEDDTLQSYKKNNEDNIDWLSNAVGQLTVAYEARKKAAFEVSWKEDVPGLGYCHYKRRLMRSRSVFFLSITLAMICNYVGHKTERDEFLGQAIFDYNDYSYLEDQVDMLDAPEDLIQIEPRVMEYLLMNLQDAPTLRELKRFYELPSLIKANIKLKTLRKMAKKLDNYELAEAVNKKGLHNVNVGIVGNLQNIFEKKIIENNEVIIAFSTNLMWQNSGSREMLFEDSYTYIRKLNNAKFASYSDWRIPTMEELLSLVEPDLQNGELHINLNYFKAKQWLCFSIDEVAEQQQIGWLVNFRAGGQSGFARCGEFADQAFIRAVRTL